MSKLVGLLAAVVLVSVAIFDVGKESREFIGLGPVIILLAFGALMWAFLSKLANRQAGHDAGLPFNLALWLHSFFEGALGALSFSFGIRTGIIISFALLIHILPEGLAVMAVLKQTGFSYRYGLRTYAISVLILLASFGLLGLVLPSSSEVVLTIAATFIGGSFIYLSARTIKRNFLVN